MEDLVRTEGHADPAPAGVSSPASRLRSPWPRCARSGLLHIVFAAHVVLAFATRSAADEGSEDLFDLELESLMELEVSIVSKKSQSVALSPAAVTVVTAEDMRRTGAASLPEALRLVPGFNVARIDANKWAISSRGFVDRFSSKLLVMVDGRSVYTPLFSGAYWDVQDYLLEDIDRIEVVRGPGASTWGANAVNGVINVLTRSAAETHGTLVKAGVGTDYLVSAAIRHGFAVSPDLDLRVYAKYFTHNEFELPDGREADDAWQIGRAGFRGDWRLSERDTVTFQGDAYLGEEALDSSSATFSPPFRTVRRSENSLAGGNLLGRWTRRLDDDSEWRVQAYYDGTYRDAISFEETRHTFDLSFEHRLPLAPWNELIWGGGYRVSSDDIESSATFSLDPGEETVDLFTMFLHDEVTLLPEVLFLSFGTKIEHNDYTGFEIQPTGRLLWKPHPDHVLWGAVSRAMRTPSRIENDGRIDVAVFPGAGGLNVVSILGSSDFQSEELTAFELGWRSRPIDRLSIDLATFFHLYDDLFTGEPGTPFAEGSPPPPHTVLPTHFDNEMRGKTFGVELALDYQAFSWWRLAGSFTWLGTDLDLKSSSQDFGRDGLTEGHAPRFQAAARSHVALPWDLELDTMLYFVDRLHAIRVPSYLRFDARLGWRPSETFELSIVGRNLLESSHLEFRTDQASSAVEVPRTVFAQLVVRF